MALPGAAVVLRVQHVVEVPEGVDVRVPLAAHRLHTDRCGGHPYAMILNDDEAKGWVDGRWGTSRDFPFRE